MRKISVLVLLLLVSSCWTTKKTTSNKISTLEKQLDSLSRVKNHTEVDTVEVFSDRVVVDEIETVIRVPIDCDSLGNVANLSIRNTTGSGSSDISIVDGELVIKTKTDSIVSVFEERYRSKYVRDSLALVTLLKTDTSTAESIDTLEVVSRWPWWLWAIIAAAIALFVLRLVKPKWLPF